MQQYNPNRSKLIAHMVIAMIEARNRINAGEDRETVVNEVSEDLTERLAESKRYEHPAKSIPGMYSNNGYMHRRRNWRDKYRWSKDSDD